MKIELEPEDFTAIRDAVMGHIDFEPTDDQIRVAIAGNFELLGLAAAWYWNDTEVRDQVCAALERAKTVQEWE